MNPFFWKKRVLRVASEQCLPISSGIEKVAHQQGRFCLGLQGGVTVDLVGKYHRQSSWLQHFGLPPHSHRGTPRKHQEQF